MSEEAYPFALQHSSLFSINVLTPLARETHQDAGTKYIETCLRYSMQHGIRVHSDFMLCYWLPPDWQCCAGGCIAASSRCAAVTSLLLVEFYGFYRVMLRFVQLSGTTTFLWSSIESDLSWLKLNLSLNLALSLIRWQSAAKLSWTSWIQLISVHSILAEHQTVIK